MIKNSGLEQNDDWKTNTICEETGTYVCRMHPYVEKYVVKGDYFPKCDQKGIPHNTKWDKIV